MEKPIKDLTFEEKIDYIIQNIKHSAWVKPSQDYLITVMEYIRLGNPEQIPDPIKPIDPTFPFYELESKSQAILEELLDIVDGDERHGYRDSIMDLEDNLAISLMLIQKYNDINDVRKGYKRKAKNIHSETEILTHKRGGYVGGDVYKRVVRALTK